MVACKYIIQKQVYGKLLYDPYHPFQEPDTKSNIDMIKRPGDNFNDVLGISIPENLEEFGSSIFTIGMFLKWAMFKARVV